METKTQLAVSMKNLIGADQFKAACQFIKATCLDSDRVQLSIMSSDGKVIDCVNRPAKFFHSKKNRSQFDQVLAGGVRRIDITIN